MTGIHGTHHFALRVTDYDGLLKWKHHLTDSSLAVDGPFDRHYFTSIYFNDLDGHIVERATVGSVDEDETAPGQELLLPSWLESQRAQIEQVPMPVTAAPWVQPEVSE